ncbi:MAG: flagellar biosynthetic protein FliO [Verrucomicrobiota bacterium]
MTSVALAENTTLAPIPSILPDVGFSFVRVLGALAIVLALFLGGVWLFRNWQRLVGHRGRSPRLSVLETRPLGNRHGLYVVRYEQQRMLLASSPTSVTLISHLPDCEPPAEPLTVSDNAPFAQTLQRVLVRAASLERIVSGQEQPIAQ